MEKKVVHEPTSELERVLGFHKLSEGSVDFLQKHNILDTLATKKRAHETVVVAKKSSSQIEMFNIAEVE